MRFFLSWVLVFGVAACGESDPNKHSKRYLLGMCIERGETIEACECEIKRIEDELSPNDFRLIMRMVDAVAKRVGENSNVYDVAEAMAISAQPIINWLHHPAHLQVNALCDTGADNF